MIEQVTNGRRHGVNRAPSDSPSAPGNERIPAWPPLREVVWAGLLYGAVLAVLLSATAITPEREGRGHDGRFYAMMSRDEHHAVAWLPVAPFCYRPLTPALAGLLPGSVVARFREVGFLSWWAALIAWHVLARLTGASSRWSMFGALMLATCAWGPIAAFYNPCYVDPMMHALVIVGLILVVRRSRLLAVFLPLAMLQREQCLIVWVCAVADEWRRTGWTRRMAIYHGGILVTCMGVYGAVRLIVTPLFSTTPAPWKVIFGVGQWMIAEPRYALISVLAVTYALGVPLAAWLTVADVRTVLRSMRWPGYFLFLSLLSIFCGSDKARLVFLAQPVLILGLILALNRSGLRRVPWLAAALFAVHLYMQLPPARMIADGRIQAPLIDEMDRGTHGANALHGPGYRPVALTDVATHVAVTFAAAVLLLCGYRLRAARISRRTPVPDDGEAPPVTGAASALIPSR